MSNKPVDAVQDLGWGLLVLPDWPDWNIDWVLVAPIYDKNGTHDSVVINEPWLHDSFKKQGVRLDVGIESRRCDVCMVANCASVLQNKNWSVTR
jgi:hypothetical protein